VSDKIENTLTKIESKIDSMQEVLIDARIILSRNTQILDEHQRRSVASEERADALEAHVDILKDSLVSELLPIKNYIGTIKTLLKVVTGLVIFIAGGAGFILTLKQIGLLN